MAIAPPKSADLAAFKAMWTETDVANFFDISLNAFRFHLYSKHRPVYTRFTLKKSSGGIRHIASPPPVLTSFQEKILQCITYIVHPKEPCHGFTRDRSVVTNARRHVGANLILNIDIENFFPSINFGRVRGVFGSHPFSFSSSVSSLLAHICCDGNQLPQGAPTSPIIANLVCRGLDNDLFRFAKRHGCKYSRYADDITISTLNNQLTQSIVATPPTGDSRAPTIGVELLSIIQKNGFRLNDGKSRLSTRDQRQEVTGLVVNRKVNVKRSFVRNIRAIIHDIETNGTPLAQQHFSRIDDKQRLGAPPSVIDHLYGKLDYLRMVRKSDDPLYVSLALRAQQVSPRGSYGVPIFGKSAIESFWLRCLWIVRCIDANGTEVSQGTAFSLNGIGIVSAAHVFAGHLGQRGYVWELRNGFNPQQILPITHVQMNHHLDLAIIRSSTQIAACLEDIDNRAVATGNAIHALGYPQWHTPGDGLAVAPGQIVQIRPNHGVTELVTNAHVRGGMSGGPILAQDGRVVGVALRDFRSALTPNGGHHVKHIHHVAREPLIPI